MNVTLVKKVLSAILCGTLIALTTPNGAAAFQSQTPAPATDYSGQGAPQTAAELQGLVAPIALYPDALVAQILSGATFPDQIAVADNWLQTNKALTGSALTQAVDKQTWDPSVKALTQFPDVLDKMAQSLAWTSSLGEAYHNQQADVMAAIQALETLTRPAKVRLFTDSSYLRNGITSWLAGWKRNGWLTKDRKPVKNADLWQRLAEAVGRHEIEWLWVKGHAGDPGNERADISETTEVAGVLQERFGDDLYDIDQ